jgi:hypothetical protein
MDYTWIGNLIRDWLLTAGLPDQYANLITTIIVVILIFLLAYIANFVTRKCCLHISAS